MGRLLSMVLIFGASYEPLACPRNKVGPISGPIDGPIVGPIVGPIGVEIGGQMWWLLSMVLTLMSLCSAL